VDGLIILLRLAIWFFGCCLYAGRPTGSMRLARTAVEGELFMILVFWE